MDETQKRKENFAECEVYLCEPHRDVLGDIRHALKSMGFENIVEISRGPRLWEMLEDGSPDLLIFDVDMDGGKTMGLINAIRQRIVGENPFLPMIATTWDAKPETIRKVTGLGADDILIKPVSIKNLMTRIDTIVYGRKPFIVTSDYIGPDRRKDPSRGSNIKQIDVPNTFRKLALGEPMPARGEMIENSWTEINLERQHRNAFQIGFLVNLLLPQLKEDDVDDDGLDYIDRLFNTTKDALNRFKDVEHLPQFKNSPFKVLTENMNELAAKLQLNPDDVDAKTIKLLTPLSMAINKAVAPDSDEAALAHDIGSAINNFQKRKAGQRV